MTTSDQEKFEHYLFLRLYGVDFDRAREALDEVAKHDALHRREATLRDAIVSYCRPFSGNQGDVMRKHRLRADDYVPPASRLLHNELIALRDQLFAHSDLTYHEPKAMRSGPAIYMTFKVADYDLLLPRTSEIRQLVVAVDEGVVREARRQHAEPWFAANLEHTLPMGSMNVAGRGIGTHRMTTIVQILQDVDERAARGESGDDREAASPPT